uniref:NADH-quinone oxidoreductase subunit J n=1 Tax=candidate division WOR-3 bacterium TaxID=2052148 RepID=A0A7V0Z5N1_UNCW3
MQTLYLISILGLVFFSILAILIKDLLKAALSLMGASIFLAIIFFFMKAYYAGVFEISVVAGLITVLFVSTIGLTRSDDFKESKVPTIIFPLFFIWFIIIDILIFGALINRFPVMGYRVSEPGTFGEVFWHKRTFDLVGQIGIIFAGVFSVLALFRKRDKNG